VVGVAVGVGVGVGVVVVVGMNLFKPEHFQDDNYSSDTARETRHLVDHCNQILTEYVEKLPVVYYGINDNTNELVWVDKSEFTNGLPARLIDLKEIKEKE
jgi:hypothetical protein